MWIVLAIAALLIALMLLSGLSSGTAASGTRPVRPAPGASAAGHPRPSHLNTTRPAPHTAPHKERTMIAKHANSAPHNGRSHADRYELDATKTVQAFDFILKSFGRTPPWTTAAQRDDHVHDLTVMLRHGDLERASLELVGADDTVIYRHRIEFGRNGGSGSVDADGGIELPLLARHQIARHRILVSPAARLDDYRPELRNGWGRAPTLNQRTGSCFASDHTRRVNAGRMNGEVFVADEARHTVTVLNVAVDGQYAFGRSAALAADVFLHRGQCAEAVTFQPGQRLSCVVIQTPRGLQGRNIRAGRPSDA